MRYDGPGEGGGLTSQPCTAASLDQDEVDQFVEEEMRLAESMSMAVFLNLNKGSEFIRNGLQYKIICIFVGKSIFDSFPCHFIFHQC